MSSMFSIFFQYAIFFWDTCAFDVPEGRSNKSIGVRYFEAISSMLRPIRFRLTDGGHRIFCVSPNIWVNEHEVLVFRLLQWAWRPYYGVKILLFCVVFFSFLSFEGHGPLLVHCPRWKGKENPLHRKQMEKIIRPRKKMQKQRENWRRCEVIYVFDE